MRSITTAKLKQWFTFGALPMTALLLSGCSHLYYADPNPSVPYAFPNQPANSAPNTAMSTGTGTSPVPSSANTTSAPVLPAQPNKNNLPPVGLTSGTLPATPPTNLDPGAATVMKFGDMVTVTFMDLLPPVEIKAQRIGEDGKIVLPYNVSVVAVGKTPSQLQEEIRTNYVPRYFVQMTPIVKTDVRFYFVGGEVRNPNRQQYEGDMSVLRAIDTAGGFGEFANKKKVQLHRSNGRKYIIDIDKARKDPTLDLPVYANDQVFVPRKNPFGF